MTAPRDKFGRPIVVVTGMGVVTSLGAGKADNWAKLTAGESGIRTITRFPDRWPENDDGRNGRFRAGRAFFLDRSFASGLPISPPKKPSRSPQSAAKVIFPDRCFLPSPRSRSNGRNGWNLDARPGKLISTMTPSCGSAAADDSPNITAVSSSVRSPIISPRNSAPRVRRFRFRRPARRAPPPSSSASKPFAAARRTRRCASRPMVRSIRKPWSGSHCCRRCRPITIRRRRRCGRSRRTATAS